MTYPQDPHQQGAYQPQYQPQNQPQYQPQSPPQHQQPYQPQYQPQYQQPQSQQPPAKADKPSRSPLLLAGAAGFVLAAVIALVLSLTGVLPGSDSSPSSDSISLPDKIGSYVQLAQTKAAQSTGGKKSIANAALVSKKTAEALSAAHDGAGAAVKSYTSPDLQVMFGIWAVRDATPRPVVVYQDAAYLGLSEPQQVVKKFGNSYCQLFATQATPAGQAPTKNDYIATTCVRSDGDLTVAFIGGGGSDLAKDPTAVAKLVDEVWDSIH